MFTCTIISASGKTLDTIPCKNRSMADNIQKAILAGNTKYPRTAKVVF